MLAGANDKFFTTNLNIIAAAKLVINSDDVFRRAIAKDVESSGKDAGEYLWEVKMKAAQYLEEDEICGRADIIADIKGFMLQKGSLTFVTGGSSVGKSKIMESIVKAIGEAQLTGEVTELPKARVSVFMADGRGKKDLVAAMSDLATGKVAAVANKASLTFPYGASVGFDFPNADFKVSGVAEAVGKLARMHSRETDHSVLILDEANAFLQCKGEDEVVKRAKQLIQAVVCNTKQNMLMSVVLVSSNEGLGEELPYHLMHLGVNPHHISNTLVISEPTPRECLDLLQKKFGVGEHLSTALLDCYGGNVYQMCMLLMELPDAYQREESQINIFMGPSTSISRALSAWREDGGEEAEILEVLEGLARTGFVPMSSGNNKLVRLLTKFYVCAYLTAGAEEYQVPRELRAKREGLVPASHLLRVLIARKLVQIEVSEQV